MSSQTFATPRRIRPDELRGIGWRNDGAARSRFLRRCGHHFVPAERMKRSHLEPCSISQRLRLLSFACSAARARGQKLLRAHCQRPRPGGTTSLEDHQSVSHAPTSDATRSSFSTCAPTMGRPRLPPRTNSGGTCSGRGIVTEVAEGAAPKSVSAGSDRHRQPAWPESPTAIR